MKSAAAKPPQHLRYEPYIPEQQGNRRWPSLLKTVLLGLTLSTPGSFCFAETLAETLARTAPDTDPAVVHLPVEAMDCATSHSMPSSAHLAVIDYSRPSLQSRLWVFDLEKHRLLFRELVAHGRNSGENDIRFFFNDNGSLASSLGLFRTLDSYVGGNDYLLSLDGPDPGFNDHALERAIVMLGAPYVNAEVGQKFGRSWECPAVASRMIDTLKGGQFMFSYYPDPHWLASTAMLNCHRTTLARNESTGGNIRLYSRY